MENEVRLDEISAFGDKLVFLVPHEWVEGDEGDDLCFFHAPSDSSGGLRVSLITVTGVRDSADKFKRAFKDAKALQIDEDTGNWVDRWEKDSVEDGAPIHLYYWKVANALPPDIFREAIFSYTVLASQVGLPETERTVKLLGIIAPKAAFH